MQKVAWNWGSDSSVINDPLGEPGHTPQHVGLPSAWVYLVGNRMFSQYFVEGLLFGDSNRYK